LCAVLCAHVGHEEEEKKLRAEVKKSHTKAEQVKKDVKWKKHKGKEIYDLICVWMWILHTIFRLDVGSLCTRKKEAFLGVLREREKFITEWVWAKHRTAFWLVSIFYFHFSGYSSKSKSSSSIFSSSLIIFLLSFCVLIHEEIRGARRGLKKNNIK